MTIDVMQETTKVLPRGWRWARLGDAGKIASGVTLGRRFLNTPTRSVLYLRVANVKDGHLDLSEVYRIDVPESDIAKCRLQYGDLLLTEGGDPDKLGRGTFWENQLPECIHQNHIFRVRLDPSHFYPQFVAAQISSPYGKAYFLAHAKQTTGIATINQKVLANFPLMIPPLPEQSRIAALLTEQMAAVERARAAAEARLEAARALPAALLRQVFESEEAQRWNRRKLSEVCEIVAPLVDPKIPEYGCLSHVSGENIESGTCRLLPLRTAAEDGMISGKYLFDPGDVLYSKIRPYLRKVVVADFRGLCSADIYPIKVNLAALNPHFLCWSLITDEFTAYGDDESQRSRMPKLNREQLFDWLALVPPLDIQENVVTKLQRSMWASDRTGTALQSQLDAINALPAALLRRAFNGEL